VLKKSGGTGKDSLGGDPKLKHWATGRAANKSIRGGAEEGAEKVGLRAVKRKPGAEAHCKQGTFGTTEVVP
jgi:hypothetical protein